MVALKIDKDELINAVGYIDLEISSIQSELNQTAPNDAKIEQYIQNMEKLLNTVKGKQQMPNRTAKYSESELENMRIKKSS